MLKTRKFAVTLLAIVTVLSLCFGLTACLDDEPTDSSALPEGSFTITSPADGAKDVSTTPEITWSAENNATKYLVEISKEENAENPVFTKTVEELTVTVANPLEHSVKYYLTVTAMKVEDGKDIALSYKKSSFTTAAEHTVDPPDYTKTRTVYDFEDMTDEDLASAFGMHTAGDTADLSLIERENGKAMKVALTKGTNGWAGVIGSLPAEKKVWSGTKGIRMYVQASAGVTIEVRFGKRGYQSWSAEFTANNTQPTYVAIPYEKFADAGGGDGILDLSGITRLWFFFKGNMNGEVIIDDITIGSDELHTTDTRSVIEKAVEAEIGVVEDFENYKDNWVLENATAQVVSNGALGGEKSLAVTPSSSWATVGYTLSPTDYSNVTAITFKASAGVYVLQLISGSNVVEKQFACAADGDITGVNVSELEPQNSSMNKDLTKIDYVRIGIKDKSGATVLIDDFTLSDEEFVPADHSAKMIADFENGMTFEDVFTAQSQFGYEIKEDNGNHYLAVTATASFGMEVKNLAVLDFTETLGFTAKITSDVPVSIEVAFGSYGNVYEYFYKHFEGSFDLVLDYNEATLRANNYGELNKANINFMQIWVKAVGTMNVSLDDMRFYSENDKPAAAEEQNFGLMLEDFEGEYKNRFDMLPGTATVKTENDNSYLSVACKGPAGLQIAGGYVLGMRDLSKAKGFALDLTINQGATLEIKLGSANNYYVLTRKVYEATNNIKKIVVDFDQMKLADGSWGALAVNKIDFVQIWFTAYEEYTVTLDNIGFYTDSSAFGSKVIDDFSAYATDDEIRAKWNANNLYAENGKMKMTTNFGWNGTQFNLCPGVGTIGGEEDYQNCRAMKITLSSTVDFTLVVKATRWSNSLEKEISLSAGENQIIVVYFSDMTDKGITDMIFNSITIGVTYYGTTDIMFEKVEFLIG